MINGDVLPGRVARAVTGNAAFPMPDHLVVEDVLYAGEVRVRLDWVRRVFRASGGPDTNSSDQTPNFLRLVGGKRVECRAIRWSSSCIDVLTSSETLSVPYESSFE